MILDTVAFKRATSFDKVPVCCDFCKAVLAPRMKSNILTGFKKHPFHCCMKGFCQGILQIATGNKEPLSVTHPELAAEWHPTKNGDITTDMVLAGCNGLAWWIDKHGHEWEAPVSDRTNKGSSCPECRKNNMSKIMRETIEQQIASGERKSLKEEYPEIAEQWHPTKNAHLKCANGIDILTADWVTAGSHETVWWLDVHGHEWEATVKNRTISGSGCPHCAEHGFTPQDRAIVYLLQQPDKMKIGITNLYTDINDNSRIKQHQRNCWEVVDYIDFQVGQDAYDLEQKILAHLDANKIRRGFSAFLEFFDGYTECWRGADYSPQSIAEIIAALSTS